MQKRKRKYRWFRIAIWTFSVILVLFIIACFVFDHYVQFRRSDKALKKIFAERELDAAINYYTVRGRDLRYISSGNDSLPTLLMLHGSPGSISYYAGRLSDESIRNYFKVYAVDRPGYGYSGFGNPEPSIQNQAEMIRPILDSLHKATHPVIILGSSYGASIACRIAMDHPELVDGLILTGPAIAPGQEKYFWFTHIIENGAIRWFIPRLFKSANTEKVHHKKELEKMLPYWKNIRVPVIYIQGENDEIVDTTNASFAKREMVNAPSVDIKFLKNRGHRLAQFEWPAIRESIIQMRHMLIKK